MTTLLERREIEALFAKAVYDELVPEIGADGAEALLGRVARKLAMEMGRDLAAGDGQTDLETFNARLQIWREGDAMDIEEIAADAGEIAFDVKRCGYADMYERLGIRHLGAALSCNRDGSLCEGYDPRIRMQRTKTLMKGNDRCDFRFTIDDGAD